MRAAIYARKSTDQTGVSDDARSVVRQIDHARTYAERKGWHVLEEHIYSDDGISGAEFLRRPSFVRLMAALKPRAPFDVLVMSEESRLGRESIETAYAFKQIIGAGVRVFSYLTDSERTLDSAIDKVMLSLVSFADEVERERARQRTYDAMQRKARAGHVCGGSCFGYRNVEVSGEIDAQGTRPRLHVTRVIHEPEAAVVRELFDRYAQGWGLVAIAKALNAEGKPSPRPQRGRPSGWAPSSVRSILLRSMYRGEIVWNKSRKRTTQGTIHQRPRPSSEWISTSAPELRIVTDEQWFAVQRRFEQHARQGAGMSRRPGATSAKYLLSGLARCTCGSGIEAISHKSGDTRAFAYACAANRRRGASVCANDLRVPMPAADEAVLEMVEGYILQPSIIAEAVERAVSVIAGEGVGDRRAALVADAVSARGQIGRLVSALADGGESASLAGAIRDRETKLREIEQQITAMRAAPVAFDRGKVRRALNARVGDWKNLLRSTPPAGHAALRALISDRLTFSPQTEGESRYYAIEGVGTIAPLLSGLVQVMASPPGIEPGSRP